MDRNARVRLIYDGNPLDDTVMTSSLIPEARLNSIVAGIQYLCEFSKTARVSCSPWALTLLPHFQESLDPAETVKIGQHPCPQEFLAHERLDVFAF